MVIHVFVLPITIVMFSGMVGDGSGQLDFSARERWGVLELLLSHHPRDKHYPGYSRKQGRQKHHPQGTVMSLPFSRHRIKCCRTHHLICVRHNWCVHENIVWPKPASLNLHLSEFLQLPSSKYSFCASRAVTKELLSHTILFSHFNSL